MKNERLMDALGNVSPALVAEAAPGNLPASAKRPIRPLRMLIAAAIVIAIMMVSVLGMTISAEESEPALQELPVIILREDFDRMVKEMYQELEDKSEFNDCSHYALRHMAFYEQQFMLDTLSPNAKEHMLEKFPITELCDVYVLDETATDVDKAWLLEQFRLIGFSQLDLIESYEKLYRMVEESDSENKEKILASLPEIPERPE